jgi:hypothetical protein
VSEYQYYEFQAIDRPLTSHEMRRLRACSTRATITATRFVNHYEWGSFKGDVEGWMGKYFDAFVYIANWGTHELALRFPRSTLDLKTARRYAGRAAAFARSSRDFVVLTLLSEVGAGSDEDWNDDGTGWLSSLTPIRSDIATGDRRALYLMWLFRAQEGEFDDDETEPPIPAGLRTLSAPLEALIEFLRINKDLVTVAAERSHAPERDSKVRHDLSRWIASLPEAEKTALLLRTASGEHAAVHSELVRRHRGSSVRRDLTAVASRTVGQLLRAANRRTEERRRLDAERAASQKALRDQAIAATREKYLNNLAEHEAATWGRVEKLIATKRPGQYDEAVSLLSDLRDVGARRGRAADIATRIEQLQTKHATKPSLLARLSRAGLLSENGGRTTRGR